MHFPSPGRTRMRTLGVTRQTRPMNGVLPFFRHVRPRAVRLWQRVLTAWLSREQLARACTQHVLRLWHQAWVMAAKRRMVLGGREASLSPHAVLGHRMAEPLVFARETQARAQGSPRPAPHGDRGRRAQPRETSPRQPRRAEPARGQGPGETSRGARACCAAAGLCHGGQADRRPGSGPAEPCPNTMGAVVGRIARDLLRAPEW